MHLGATDDSSGGHAILVLEQRRRFHGGIRVEAAEQTSTRMDVISLSVAVAAETRAAASSTVEVLGRQQ